MILVDRNPAWMQLNPEIAAVFKKTNGPPKLPIPTRKTVPIFREQHLKGIKRFEKSRFAKKHLPDPSAWSESDGEVPVRDGNSIKIRVYLPNSSATRPLPLAVLIHGGGWFMGDLSTDAFICRVLCIRLGVAVVNVDYRLYPDVDFPVPTTDCHDVVRWLARNYSQLSSRIDPSLGFILGGMSGGGTYASIVCHLARDEQLSPKITGCYLACPVLSTAEDVDPKTGGPIPKFPIERVQSPDQCEDAPLMNKRMREAITDFAHYDFTSPLLTPFHFSSHAHLPRTYTQVCGLDPWRDSGIVYHEELLSAGDGGSGSGNGNGNGNGNESRLDIFSGLPHCWWSTYPDLRVSEEWLSKTIQGWEWLLPLRPNQENSHGTLEKARTKL